MTQQRKQVGHGLMSYLFAGLGVLTSLLLGIATLTLGVTQVEPDAQGPSVSVEELDPNAQNNADAPKAVPNTPGFDPKQANLVSAEDARTFALVSGILPGTPPRDLASPGSAPTLVLPSRSAPYDLAALISAKAVVKQPDGGFLLVHNVLVTAGAQLNLAMPSGTLRMSSGPGGITSIIGFKSIMMIGGADHAPLTITSWDPTKNAPDTDASDGRAYIRDIGGRMDVHDTNTESLGFWSGRTGGLAWTGSTAEPATGSARNVNCTGDHYGIFATRSSGLLINGAQVKNSVMDGIAVHGNSDGTQLWRVTSSNNARNGILVTQGAHNISMREVTTASNARNGIYLNGKPPATGPNAGGSTTAASAGFIVDGSTSRANSEHGILVNNANNAVLTKNMVSSNRDGVIVRGATQGLVLSENQISSPGGYAVALRDGSQGAVIDKNVISDAVTAVQLNNAVAKISGNEINGMTMHAVSIIGAGSGSSIVDNRLAGQGPSSVDVNRLVTLGVVSISGNDEKNWTVDRDNAQFLANYVRKHPLILLWGLSLLLPLAARMYFKRRTKLRMLGQHPYGGQPSPVTSVSRTPPSSGAAPRPAAQWSPRPQPSSPGAGSTPRTGPPAPPAAPGTSNNMQSSNGSPRRPSPGPQGKRPQQPGATRVTVVSEQ
ncbi:right-handed parallel beta-helix repeat-containing protein [Pseudonocardia spinosispora]|uniref:right-handed parallel beta-helix repeat-containing protein n=1 Tax=Pseudonocardia spinosispora TaxID=103441 RepID=UPI00040DEA84|nr:right-handed parallel beta-helix repeat-containing protein [Pseudonocardia spinosispora]